jgi:hypothetical protein
MRRLVTGVYFRLRLHRLRRTEVQAWIRAQLGTWG